MASFPKQICSLVRRPENNFMENKNKTVCSECGSNKVRTIVYGLVKFNSKADQEKAEKEYYYCGCEILRDRPKFHCDNCDKNFGDTLADGRLPLDHKPLTMKPKNKNLIQRVLIASEPQIKD